MYSKNSDEYSQYPVSDREPKSKGPLGSANDGAPNLIKDIQLRLDSVNKSKTSGAAKFQGLPLNGSNISGPNKSLQSASESDGSPIQQQLKQLSKNSSAKSSTVPIKGSNVSSDSARSLSPSPPELFPPSIPGSILKKASPVHSGINTSLSFKNHESVQTQSGPNSGQSKNLSQSGKSIPKSSTIPAPTTTTPGSSPPVLPASLPPPPLNILPSPSPLKALPPKAPPSLPSLKAPPSKAPPSLPSSKAPPSLPSSKAPPSLPSSKAPPSLPSLKIPPSLPSLKAPPSKAPPSLPSSKAPQSLPPLKMSLPPSPLKSLKNNSFTPKINSSIHLTSIPQTPLKSPPSLNLSPLPPPPPLPSGGQFPPSSQKSLSSARPAQSKLMVENSAPLRKSLTHKISDSLPPVEVPPNMLPPPGSLKSGSTLQSQSALPIPCVESIQSSSEKSPSDGPGSTTSSSQPPVSLSSFLYQPPSLISIKEIQSKLQKSDNSDLQSERDESINSSSKISAPSEDSESHNPLMTLSTDLSVSDNNLLESNGLNNVPTKSSNEAKSRDYTNRDPIKDFKKEEKKKEKNKESTNGEDVEDSTYIDFDFDKTAFPFSRIRNCKSVDQLEGKYRFKTSSWNERYMVLYCNYVLYYEVRSGCAFPREFDRPVGSISLIHVKYKGVKDFEDKMDLSGLVPKLITYDFCIEIPAIVSGKEKVFLIQFDDEESKNMWRDKIKSRSKNINGIRNLIDIDHTRIDIEKLIAAFPITKKLKEAPYPGEEKRWVDTVIAYWNAQKKYRKVLRRAQLFAEINTTQFNSYIEWFVNHDVENGILSLEREITEAEEYVLVDWKMELNREIDMFEKYISTLDVNDVNALKVFQKVNRKDTILKVYHRFYKEIFPQRDAPIESESRWLRLFSECQSITEKIRERSESTRRILKNDVEGMLARVMKEKDDPFLDFNLIEDDPFSGISVKRILVPKV